MNLLNKAIWMTLTISGFLLVFYGITRYAASDAQKARVTGTYASGKVELYGSDIICRINVADRMKMKKVSKPNSSIENSETFKVYYNKAYPGKYSISFSEPIIIDSLFLVTKIVEAKNQLGNFSFKYEVNGKVLTRYQEIRDFDNFTTNADYKVLYHKDNANIAYLVGLNNEVPPF